MVRVLVVGAAGISTRELVDVLIRTAGMHVVGVAMSADEIAEHCAEPAPDLAVMYASTPVTGPTGTRRASHAAPDVPVLVLPTSNDGTSRSLPDGVGHLLAGVSAHLDRRDRGVPAARLNEPDESDGLRRLTPVERRMLELIAGGLTNREIGNRLGLAHQTVKNYVSAIFVKLGVSRRAQAAARFARVEAAGELQHPSHPASSENGDAEIDRAVGNLLADMQRLQTDLKRLADARVR